MILCCLSFAVRVPSPPTIVLGVQSSTTLSLSWVQSPSDQVDSYSLQATYLGNCSNFSATPLSSTLNGTARQFVFTNLDEFSTYRLSVIAINSAGQSAESAIVADTQSAGKFACCHDNVHIKYYGVSTQSFIF